MLQNKLFTLMILFFSCQAYFAQTKEEIISNYIENTGGAEAWNKLQGIKMTAKVSNGGMEIPIEMYNLKDGRQMTVITFQGKEIKQQVYDGKQLWSHNFMTMEAEESDAETASNFKLELNDFPNPFLNYEEKGYSIELMGNETIEGTETFKIKLIQEPVTVEGKKEESISFYFFDTENFVPIAMQSEVKVGPAKGMIAETTFSDYQEVDGLYFPFSMSQGEKGKPGEPISMTAIVLNPKVDDAEFTFPEKK
ncbi:MAG: outer membrane lipoprotein-sorting protein [Crocinitomicaceae bacterium]|jgi:outer membrane lipoprotein-sorting protein|tara:strand:+ start:25733 stop:26485 length:753 start_codon:yes stop_codon:yes gene_type:complete